MTLPALRLTELEESALLVALAQVLAGPLDGFDETDEQEAPVRQAMEGAQAKLWARQISRRS